MLRLWVSVVCLCALVGCAQKNMPANVYYTTGGIGEFQQLGPVTGTASGYCMTRAGVMGAAVQNALEKSIARGGNAVLIPNSISSYGVAVPTRCRWGWTIFGIPGAIGERVQTIAIYVPALEWRTEAVQAMLESGQIVLAEHLEDAP